jgi:single-strand DNA-binding protein
MLKTTPNGHPVCSFAVASNRFYKQNEDTEKEVSFFDIETWSKLAQTCGDVLKKGRGVRVVGRLKQDRWTDNGGKNQSRIKIVAEHVEFKPVFRKETDPQTITEAAESGLDTYAEEREPEAEAVF